jgi:hypothetical protein
MLSIGVGTPSNRKRRQTYGGYGSIPQQQQQFVQQSPHSSPNLLKAIVATGPLKVSLGSFCSKIFFFCFPKKLSSSKI